MANRYMVDHSPIEFYGLGATYDPGKWFVTTEYGHQKTDSFIGEQRAWYVTGGYRVGSLTPYATYAQVRTLSRTSDPGLDVGTIGATAAAAAASLPPGTPAPIVAATFNGVFGAGMGLNALVNSLLMSTNQNTITLGLRWDFAKSAALKVQYDRLNLGDNAMGILRNLPADGSFKPGGHVNLFSVAVDFVF